MKWQDAGHWELEVDAEITGDVRLEYSYIYKADGLELREPESSGMGGGWEAGPTRTFRGRLAVGGIGGQGLFGEGFRCGGWHR